TRAPWSACTGRLEKTSTPAWSFCSARLTINCWRPNRPPWDGKQAHNKANRRSADFNIHRSLKGGNLHEKQGKAHCQRDLRAGHVRRNGAGICVGGGPTCRHFLGRADRG